MFLIIRVKPGMAWGTAAIHAAPKEHEMKFLKHLCLTAVATMAVLALSGPSIASATTFATKGVPINAAESYSASLKSGGSMMLKDSNGILLDTCTSSNISGTTMSPFTGATVGGSVSTLLFGGCSHTTHVIKPGNLSFSWTSGTNGHISSSGAEWTYFSTLFGASCVVKTGTGTALGTFTGVKEGNGTIHINDGVPMGICGTGLLTATYTVTTANLAIEP